MKTIFSFFALVSILNLFAVSSVRASHVAGGEITYRWVSGNTYHIVFTLYRDCHGIAAPTSLQVVLYSSCGDNITATATLVPGTGTLISPCQGVLTFCNGGTYPGIQKWQYYLDDTLPHQCSDWTFAYSQNARNAAITTLQNPSAHNIYIEANLNDSLFEHDSPVFTSEPPLSICIGTPQVINCSAIDDCDSLVYSFIRPRGNSALDTLAYNAGYDSIYFISSGILPSIDSAGMISVVPTGVEAGVYVVRVQQYRNGVLIGSIMRDMVIYTQACASSPIYLPQISGINGTNQYSAIFSANHTTCFNLFSSDSDSTQTTHLTLGASLLGDTLILDTMPHQSGIFCWTPLITDTGACPHCFSVRVNDDFCPPGIRSYKYCITVVDSGFILNANTIDSKFYVTVSPNPFSKSATVTVHGSPPLLQRQFILFDALGRTVMNIAMAKNEMTIDGTLLPAGIYFYSIREDNTTMATGKIVITQ